MALVEGSSLECDLEPQVRQKHLHMLAMAQYTLGEGRIAGMVDEGVPQSMGLQVGGDLWKLSWKTICRRGDHHL